MPQSDLTRKATSAKSDLWATPRGLAALLVKEFQVDVDLAACATTAVTGFYLGPDARNPLLTDALACSWSSLGSVGYLNPPFGLLKDFAYKAIEEAAKGFTTVALLPANKWEQPWARECLPLAREWRFLEGRVAYGEPAAAFEGYQLNGPYTEGASALFPSMVVVWAPLKGRLVSPLISWWNWRQDVA